ncbi:hypothetical protein B0I35DRAFT_423577 [Stachybotrys elegans]|uniref:Actin cytoskeleton-regulatory complex protein SLA1 n=1 Tax=Stachybotrys elegans TaxID=80388 RepID=A0A8K0T5Z2_9HYPO|nr:hypothetical protein B0I35DRAFT_423577 [Stachybotrys elegans]
MGFLGVCKAIYDYTPQAKGELAIEEGDLLYVIENKGDDGWWKAKKKAGTDDEDEPVGLVPNNYVEEAPPISQARALYEYTRQTDEELSFPEDALLDVFDTSDPDWILVGLDKDYGFVPSNYIEIQSKAAVADAPSAPAPPALPTRQQSVAFVEPDPEPESEPSSPVEATPARGNPAAALAGVMQARAAAQPASPPPQPTRPPALTRNEPQYSDDEPIRSPALPSRPRPPVENSYDDGDEAQDVQTHRTPGGFHMYNINEMVSVMGKRKKMPTTLGINLLTGMILIAPEKAQDGPSQEWSAEKMTHYSREGKHVFMELVRPSKSIDFHAGAKDTAEEIVAALGELAGAVRAEGLREVIMAGTQKNLRRGQILYDFMAQGDDEVTVAVGDEVIIIDDSKSEEWWQVRRIKNGKEGVVPSSYVEITGTITPPPPSQGHSSAKSTVEQNRMEELRLTKEALKASKETQQVGPGMPLPARGSSRTASDQSNNSGQQRSRHESGRGESSSQSKSKSKPDASKVRTWTDRSKSFSVEAQFLGLKDGKIHLHKMNGVKIAVPIAKMSHDDLEYVERTTGISLDDEKPLADVKKSKQSDKRATKAGASVEKSQSDYDWFTFFLNCEVAIGLCERYAQAFAKDSMDESVLPDVDATILRNLGLREGDIIKVMRTLDAKYGRNRGGKRSVSFASESGEGEGGLFSGPGGTLRNNTRKGRPAPAVQTSDVVDAAAFSPRDPNKGMEDALKSPSPASPAVSGGQQQAAGGFDDDAWDVKPSKQQAPAAGADKRAASPAVSTPTTASAPAAAPAPAQPSLTGSMKELSLLSEPLQPTKVEPQPPAIVTSPLPTQPQAAATNAQPQLQGATPSFFTGVAQSQQSSLSSTNLTSPQAMLRQRPTPPHMSTGQNSLVPPPPQRPLSAPQSAQPSAFAPPMLTPQMTGALQGQVAPPGQSLHEITQARLQQQYAAQMQQQQPAMTGYGGMQPGGLMPYATGPQGQFMQPMMTGMPNQSPFGDQNRSSQFSPMQPMHTGMQPQMTGFQQGFPNTQGPFGQAPPPGTINSHLPPALEPQRTGMPQMQPQMTGAGAFGQGMQTQTMQPLMPQQTGPPPPVRFGVSNEKKLVPQATGRRANLAQATPDNPFGF